MLAFPKNILNLILFALVIIFFSLIVHTKVIKVHLFKSCQAMFKPYYLSSLVTRFYAENSKKYYCKSDSGLFVYIQSNRFETVFTTDKMVCICKTCFTQCPFLQDLNICQIHDACFVSFWDNVLRRVCQKKTCKYIIRTYCHQSISRQGS